VTYKIDRLTRSLADFARLRRRFEAVARPVGEAIAARNASAFMPTGPAGIGWRSSCLQLNLEMLYKN